uniref:Uncharacterized protein n=1 Tax=Bursaphelenchus xylophilus TaxID=6326 RepID=A0A1I7S7R1_BURXY
MLISTVPLTKQEKRERQRMKHQVRDAGRRRNSESLTGWIMTMIDEEHMELLTRPEPRVEKETRDKKFPKSQKRNRKPKEDPLLQEGPDEKPKKMVL